MRALHADPANAQALFQVASQFNTLEMTGPSVTPEDGIDAAAAEIRANAPGIIAAARSGARVVPVTRWPAVARMSHRV